MVLLQETKLTWSIARVDTAERQKAATLVVIFSLLLCSYRCSGRYLFLVFFLLPPKAELKSSVNYAIPDVVCEDSQLQSRT